MAWFLRRNRRPWSKLHLSWRMPPQRPRTRYHPRAMPLPPAETRAVTAGKWLLVLLIPALRGFILISLSRAAGNLRTRTVLVES